MAACNIGTGIFDKNIPGGFSNPGCGHPDLNIFLQIVVNITEFALLLAGGIAVIMFMVGGLTFIFSRARPDLIERGVQTMKFAAIGTIVIILAYATIAVLNNFIVTNIQ